MALKDWKKIKGRNTWQKDNMQLFIMWDYKYHKYPWIVYLHENTYSSNESDILFHAETKSVALKYAKSYMRTH